MLESLIPGTVIWDSQFQSMMELNNTWLLQFKNGRTAYADVVIGSDGYRSKIRPYLTNIGSLYSGATIIQGEIPNPKKECPEIYKLVDYANLMAIGPGRA